MAMASLTPSLKRQRSNGDASDTASVVIQHQGDRVALLERGICKGYASSNDKRSRGRVIQNYAMSVRYILVTFAMLFLSSGSIPRFVSGSMEHRKLGHEENSHLLIRGGLNKIWEEGELEGSDVLLKHERGMDTPLVHGKQIEGSHTQSNNRELSVELGDYIRQQDTTTGEEEPSPRVRGDVREPSPSEKESSTRVEDSIINGNIRIQSTLPIKFKIDLVVKNTVTNELLKWLETTLENYIRRDYQSLVDRGRLGNKDTVTLGAVDLTLSLVQSRFYEERNLRRLRSTSHYLVGASFPLRNRNLQNRREKMMSISVIGSLNYSIEVDGSPPTPDEIEQQFREAYITITSQTQLQRAIDGANINGVVRLEEVTQIDPDEDLVSLYENGNLTDTNSPYLNEPSNGTPSESNQSPETNVGNSNYSIFATKKGGPLQRPSLVAIIIGFTLTGFLVLGLFGYLYLYCRHRKKQAKKKKKMKESITFPSTGAAAAAAAAATPTPSKRIQNSPYYSKSRPQTTTPVTNSSPAYWNTMMLSQTQSEETTYGGIESSIGSESTSDPFANELKLAASLDQEAWDESQRRKEMTQKRNAARKASNGPSVGANRNSTPNSQVPSLLSKGGLNLEEADDVEGSAIDGGVANSSGLVQSYPYGDENERLGGGYQKETTPSSSSDQWEPYNSAFPPLIEEKKDEINPSEAFGRMLTTIETNVTQPRTQSEKSGIQQSISDDVSDILSEVSEISKYVRRYEQRKDRKIKREENLQQRLSATKKASPFPSGTKPTPNTMNGRHQNHQSDDNDTPSPAPRQKLDPYPLSSYAGSFRSAKSQEAINESLSVVSDEVDVETEDSLRSQRLGISPYQTSNEELYYEDGKLRNNENSRSNRTGTTSSRSRSTRTEEDYRYAVGYTSDPRNMSSSSRLSNLRANDAIIDSSNSDVNVTYGAQVPTRMSNQNTLGTVAENSPTKQQQNNQPRPSGTKNGISKIRGMFEQKTRDQPAPIYPPGANWQNGGSLGR